MKTHMHQQAGRRDGEGQRGPSQLQEAWGRVRSRLPEVGGRRELPEEGGRGSSREAGRGRVDVKPSPSDQHQRAPDRPTRELGERAERPQRRQPRAGYSPLAQGCAPAVITPDRAVGGNRTRYIP